ncbi:MAG: SMC-Scp complex subunit ScpB [Bacillota bacterium]|jgi:segregation and condensation protein B
MKDNKHLELKKIVEALLFVAAEPLTLEKIFDICSISEQKYNKEQILESINELIYEYSDKGFVLRPIAGGWQFFTSDKYTVFIERFCQPKIQQMSKAAMETLAIIAYRQPITRQEIEDIRQVCVDSMINKLLEKNLIHEVGRKDTLGKPILYGTTNEFLRFLGLNSLADLPSFDNFLAQGE